MRGKGELVLTGQLGDVMKESARAAWTYARSHAAGLAHRGRRCSTATSTSTCPAGAIPKDGPSAGVTMATALVSALSGRPVRHDIAMTGEITLRGRVLPIGGVKEKVLGAVRAGITEIVLPKENEADLEDLPEEVRQAIEVYPVENLGEVLALTLRGASFREGRLLFGDQKPGDVAPLQAYPPLRRSGGSGGNGGRQSADQRVLPCRLVSAASALPPLPPYFSLSRYTHTAWISSSVISRVARQGMNGLMTLPSGRMPVRSAVTKVAPRSSLPWGHPGGGWPKPVCPAGPP